ncbi:Rid family hydrolase [Cupriavidus nantongensis]|uniref:Rid family hydrolase n=1 Tax=Cupriavidus nantongensis TaxID=1796606 RepID=UPI00358F6C77
MAFLRVENAQMPRIGLPRNASLGAGSSLHDGPSPKEQIMVGNARSIEKKATYWGVPWEEAYGYAQAVQVGNDIYVSGQLSHDSSGNLVAPASLDASGRPRDFSMMEAQMRVTYENLSTILARFGATLDNVVEETLYVLDVDAAFAAAGTVRKEAYGTERPQCASNLIGVSRLAMAPQLIEIACKAVLRPAAAA